MVLKKKNLVTERLKGIAEKEKFSNREAEKNRPRPRIERALEYNDASNSLETNRTRAFQSRKYGAVISYLLNYVHQLLI